MLSSKSAHHTLSRSICGFFTHPLEDIIECCSSEAPKIAFSAFQWEGSHRAALSWVINRCCLLLFCQTSIFISEKGTSTGAQRGLRPHSSHLHQHLSGALSLVQLLLSQGAGRAPLLAWLTQTLLCRNFGCKSWQPEYVPWKLINQQRFSACLCWVQTEREEI